MQTIVRRRVRIRFRKQGDLRLLGHRDLLRSFERMFRRAGLKLGMSEGFHPKPRMNFPSALGVGIAGSQELVELELAEERTAEDVLSALRPHCPDGLEVISAVLLPEGEKTGPVRAVTYQIDVPSERRAGAQENIDKLMARRSCEIEREGRKSPLDVRPLLVELTLRGDRLQMKLQTPPEGSVRPREVLGLLGLGDLEEQGHYLTRTEVELET